MCKSPASTTIARLMSDFRKGDKAAANQLVEVLYPELRRLAASRMRGERAEHSWQPTLLVNELYLALVKVKALGENENVISEIQRKKTCSRCRFQPFSDVE
jgi:hypothetical protein